MSFDPTLPTILDRIRSMVGDIDPANELIPDGTYLAVIAENVSWKLAAAEMAERIAVMIEQDVTGYTDAGVMSVSWGDRTRSLRALAARLRSEAAQEASTTTIVMVSEQLERSCASSAVEYRPRYGRRWRR